MWKNRNVWIVLIGEFIAGLGLWMSIIANLEFLQRLVPSDFVKSLILTSGLVAGVAIAPLAGRVIDAFSKKKVLLYASAGRMLSVGFMFLALNTDSIGWMIVFFVTLQASAAFYFPALRSVIPLIVPSGQLLALNGVHMNAGTIARILGTTLAGLFLAVMSLYDLYMLSMFFYGLLLISTFMLRVREDGPLEAPDVGEAKGSDAAGGKMVSAARADSDTDNGREEVRPTVPLDDPLKLGQGFWAVWPLFKMYPSVLVTQLLSIVPLLMIGAFNLIVIEISELQHDSGIKSWLYAIEGTMIIVTGFLIKRISPQGSLLGRLFSFALLVAAAEALLVFGQYPWVSLLAFGLFGLGVGGFFPAEATLFQQDVPKAYHGRFFSFNSMLERIMFQVILLVTGVLLDTVGMRWMMLSFGAFSLLLILWLALRMKGRGNASRSVSELPS